MEQHTSSRRPREFTLPCKLPLPSVCAWILPRSEFSDAPIRYVQWKRCRDRDFIVLGFEHTSVTPAEIANIAWMKIERVSIQESIGPEGLRIPLTVTDTVEISDGPVQSDAGTYLRESLTYHPSERSVQCLRLKHILQIYQYFVQNSERQLILQGDCQWLCCTLLECLLECEQCYGIPEYSSLTKYPPNIPAALRIKDKFTEEMHYSCCYIPSLRYSCLQMLMPSPPLSPPLSPAEEGHPRNRRSNYDGGPLRRYPTPEIAGPSPRPGGASSPSLARPPSPTPTNYFTAPSSPAPRRLDPHALSVPDHVQPVPNYYPERHQHEENQPNPRSSIQAPSSPSPNNGPGGRIASENMSNQDMLRLLVAHGCVDVTPRMDINSFREGFITGGAFGDIWKGRLDETAVAVKVWRLSSFPLDGLKLMKRAMREVYYWSRVKHENIQELIGVALFQGRLGMVSPWMRHGNLREYISKHPHSDRYALCVQIARGVAYLHANNMVHGDIKGPNILVSEDGIAKLSDFDYAVVSECSLAFTAPSNSRGGTYRWMAPELLSVDGSNPGRNIKTDVYALGMTMLEAITGTPPYYPECREEPQAIVAISQKKLPQRQLTYFGYTVRANRMWELLQYCWRPEPLDRPTAEEVYESIQVIATMSTEPDHYQSHFSSHEGGVGISRIPEDYDGIC